MITPRLDTEIYQCRSKYCSHCVTSACNYVVITSYRYFFLCQCFCRLANFGTNNNIIRRIEFLVSINISTNIQTRVKKCCIFYTCFINKKKYYMAICRFS